ncbi:ribonuclease P complex subunit Pop1 [Geopyxis carbonaria]|nr:ribonuclease P complex subunit Pop1 [Geopyxis carbonaria]
MSAPSRKRPPPSGPSPGSSAPRKRTRLTTARTIASSSPSLTTGTLDLPTFIRSRQFEISALTSAMSASRNAASKRAFQSLPRDLRRRTASHNPARVPQRLRQRAAKEMVDDNTPLHRAKRRTGARAWVRAQTAERLRKAAKKGAVVLTARAEGEGEGEDGKDGKLKRAPRGATRFRKRQRAKVWLPTHVWHAKRAHVGVHWGFALAERCNEKSFRATSRAAQDRGAVAWDVSYTASILLRGTGGAVGDVLAKVGVTVMKRVRDGRRVAETWMRGIAPVVVIYEPVVEGVEERRVLVRVHPAGFLECWNALLAAAKEVQEKEGEAAKKVIVEDLRFDLGSILLTGPAATDALLSILTPDGDSTNSNGSAALFQQLHNITNPASLPPGAVLSFTIRDPRLRFPPLPPSPPTPCATPHELALHWPLPSPLPSFPLLHRHPRTAAVKLQASQKRINARKGDAPAGTFPPAIETDPSIPIILHTTATPTPGWVLVLPWKWTTPAWYALMHAPYPVRFGGLTELQQVHFDVARPYFPTDFPTTAAGRAAEELRAAERKEHWDRRPPAKRVNYDAVKLGESKGEHGDWTRCDWGLLSAQKDGGEDGDKDKDTAAMDVDAPGPEITTVTLSLLGRGAPSACARIYRIPADSPWRALLPSTSASTNGNGNGKGKGNGKKQGKGKTVGTDEKDDDAAKEVALPVPGVEELVGFVTTGNYSLMEGRSVCIGGVVLRDGEKEAEKASKGERWCVVRDVGSAVGRVARWEPVV